MEPDFAKIILELTSHEASLQVELDESNKKLAVLTERLNQVQSALSALRGKLLIMQPMAKAKATRPTPTQISIDELVTKIVREKKAIQVPALLKLVKSHLLSQSQSRIGLKATLLKVLANNKFATDQNQNVTIA